MSRQKTELNPKRAERVKMIIDREKISQAEFADRIHQSQQNVSRIVTLKSALTEDNAQAIVTAFPEYRIEWLLGYDDAMTHNDWISNYFHLKDLVADGMWAIIEKSLNKQGKSLRFYHRQNQHVNATERLRADCYYTIIDVKTGTELKRLTALQMVEFEEKIQEYTDFLTERHL